MKRWYDGRRRKIEVAISLVVGAFLGILLAIVILLLFAVGASAQTITENKDGRLRVAGNELLVESFIADPSAVRLRVHPPEQGGMGKISFDTGTKEMVLLIGARSPGEGGEFSLNLLRPGGASLDADMVKVLEVSHEVGFRFNIPISAPNIGGAGTDHLLAGVWRLYQQGDGNMVQYELYKSVLCARWSIWTGPIPKHTAQPPCNE